MNCKTVFIHLSPYVFIKKKTLCGPNKEISRNRKMLPKNVEWLTFLAKGKAFIKTEIFPINHKIKFTEMCRTRRSTMGHTTNVNSIFIHRIFPTNTSDTICWNCKSSKNKMCRSNFIL